MKIPNRIGRGNRKADTKDRRFRKRLDRMRRGRIKRANIKDQE